MKTSRGFTLVELLVALAITGIALAYGVPKIGQIIQGNRVVAGINNLSAHLAYARSEAIKRSACVSASPLNAAGWERGWQVYVDINCSGTLQAGEQVLKIVDALNIPNVTIVPTANFVIYNRLGNSAASGGAGAAANNVFTLADASNISKNRTLTVAPSGHISLEIK